MQNEYLTPLLARLESFSIQIDAEFGHLSHKQINWKFHPDNWSVGQCLDHIVKTNQLYFPIFDKLANDDMKKTFWERIPFWSDYIGDMIVRSTQPIPKKKVSTFPVFEPSSSQIEQKVVQQLMKNNEELSQKMMETDLLDHRKVVVTSPLAKYITYRLHHACTLLVNHEERHMNQARKVMKADWFPN